MATIALPNSESVFYADGTTTYSAAAISSAEASSVAALMARRQRFDYYWATATQRTAQSGMNQGSRGYQVDTKTEYLYDNSAWRLATPYIEFDGGSQAIPGTGTPTGLTGWSVNGTNSTDTTIVTVSGQVLTFVRPGLYSLMVTASISAIGTTPYMTITEDLAGNNHVSIGPFVVPVGTISIPNYRVSAANTPLYLWAANTVASNVTQRKVRITRIG